MHSLDVAAVGWELVNLRPRLFDRTARQLGWSVPSFRDLWVFLLSLHDIGKFSEHFQAKVPDAWPAVALGSLDPARLFGSDPGHPAAGDALIFSPRSRRANYFEQRVAQWLRGWRGSEEDTAALLFAPIFGHHGRPVATGTPAHYLFSEQAEAAALAFADAMQELLAPPTLPEPAAPALMRVSWTLAGLTVLADWIGSNRTWFPYTAPGPDIEEYWEAARRQAQHALAAAGLGPSPPSHVTDLRILTGLDRPSPVQAWAETVALPSGPLLILIEDVTGGGKTEAALLLAHRLMAADRAAGIYFALPTMATANAMFDRIREHASRLFAEDARPSLALAHGRANLHPSFRPVTLPSKNDAGENELEDKNEADGAVEAPAWLSSTSTAL